MPAKTSKDSKGDAKETQKVMDAVHPASSSPSPASSGRPVIVSNRSYIKNDPMLNVQTDAEKPSTDPVPAPEPEKVEEDELKGPKIQLLREKKIQPTAEVAVETEAQPTETDAAASAEESDAIPEAAASEGEEPQTASEQPAVDSAPDDAVGVTSPEATAQPAPELAGSTTAASAASPNDNQLAPQAVAGEAEQQARDEEIERLIADGTYAVPLNSKKRRRNWITWSIIATVLVVIIIVDLLADMGVFTLPFGIPTTDFFVK